jgi:hypothetical protein
VRPRSYPQRWRSRIGAENTYSIWRASSDEEEKETIQIDQTGLVGVIGILANDSGGASDADTDTVRSVDNEMIIETIFSLVLSLASASETANTGTKILSALNTTTKIIEKTEKKEWKASMHEEGHQITKDSILKMGGLK